MRSRSPSGLCRLFFHLPVSAVRFPDREAKRRVQETESLTCRIIPGRVSAPNRPAIEIRVCFGVRAAGEIRVEKPPALLTAIPRRGLAEDKTQPMESEN